MPLSIISAILMRRWLTPHIIGVIATLNLFVYYSVFSSFGTMSAAEIWLPYHRGAGDLGRVERIKSSTFIISMITGIIFSTGIVVWSMLAKARMDQQLFYGLMVYSVYFVGLQISSFYITILRTTNEFIFLSNYNIMAGVATAITNVAGVWYLGYHGFLFASILVVVIQVYVLFRKVSYLPPAVINWSEIKELLLMGLPMLTMGLATQGIKTVDNILVLKLLNFNQLGYYTIALTASTIIYSITVSLSSVIYPSMQEAHGRSSNPEVLRGYIIRQTITMGILIPIFIAIMYFLVPTLVQRIIPQFIPGVVPFKIIVVFSYFFAMINMVASYLVVLNKQKMIITIYLCTILLIILISCLLTWAGWGLIGISLATGFGYLVCYAAMTIYVVRHWSAWDQTLVFLRDTMVPFLYEIPILIVIDHFHQPGSRGIIGMLVLDGAKILIFCLLFTPLVFLLEKKSNLMAGIIRPLLAKVKG